jgi:hypothetical protein
LQAEAFLRSKGFSPKTPLSENLKTEILEYLGSANEVPEQYRISRLLEQQETVGIKIAQTQFEISNVEKEADRLLRLYRYGVIALTAAHLGGFGYMIFGVEWLGWDIVEPLTFSVGSLSTLIGYRFYRKFQKDRSQETIR